MSATPLLRQVATTPPHEQEGRLENAREPVTHVVCGPLRRADELKDVYPDLILIKKHPDYIFARMPFESSAVRYKLWVSETGTLIHDDDLNARGEARKMIVVRSTWAPRKACVALMRTIYDEEGLPWTPAAEAEFVEGGASRLMRAHPESLGLRLICMHNSIKLMCCARDHATDPPFSAKHVLDLSVAQLMRAAYLMDTDPFRLCFRAASDVGLPDAPEPAKLLGWQYRAIQFYGQLKRETYDRCNSLVDTKNSIDAEAIKWLASNGVIALSPLDSAFVGLSEVYQQETALLEALAIIEASSPAVDVPRDYVPRLTSGNSLCDEQEEALDVLLHKPVLVIDGRAGSGKTDLLYVLSQLYGSKLYGTAFQGVNAGQLTRISPRVSTTHKLLYEHANRGHHSPSMCTLKGIEAFVVDEAGTQSLALLAGAVSAFALCGAQNKKLILVGDLGQMPPIGGPAPFRYLMDHFEKRGSLVHFHHNHRVKPSARLLADNANAVLDGDPDEIEWNQENFVMFTPRSGETPDAAMVRAIRQFDLKEDEFIVITHQNKHRELLCKVVEKHFGGTGEAGAQIGRKFCFTKNDYEIGVINNEILTLTAIEDRPVKPAKQVVGGAVIATVAAKRGRIEYKSSTKDRKSPNVERYLIVRGWDGATREILYEKNIVGRIRKASAVTSNAMQGSSRKVVVRVDFGPSRYSTRERLYTDFTRGEDMVLYVGEPSWIAEAVKRPEPIPLSHLAFRAAKMFEEKRD